MGPARKLRRILRSLAVAAGWLSLIVAGESNAQQVESLFLPGQDAEGYYVPISGRGQLEVAVLADLDNERPITLGARIEIKKSFFSEKTRSFDSNTELMTAGRQSSGSRDQWFLPVFSWLISCDPEGGTISFDGKPIGKSPVDVIIQVGVVNTVAHERSPQALQLLGNSIAESSEKRIVCGKFASLPKK